MQKWINITLFALLCSSPLAQAAATSSEEALTDGCHKYGLAVAKDNPEFQAS